MIIHEELEKNQFRFPGKQNDLYSIIQPLVTAIILCIPGLMIGVYILARVTIPHIALPGPYLRFQDVKNNLPVPVLLNWNISVIDLLVTLYHLPGLFAGISIIFILLLCMPGIASQLNPTFKAYRLYPANRDSVKSWSLTSAISIPCLTKLARLILYFSSPMIILSFMIFLIDHYFASSNSALLSSDSVPVKWAALLTLAGIFLFTTLSPEGAGGDFSESKIQFRAAALWKPILLGTIWGLLTYLETTTALPESVGSKLIYLQTIGTFDIQTFHQISFQIVAPILCLILSSALLMAILGSPNKTLTFMHRVIYLLISIMILVYAYKINQELSMQTLNKRYDINPQTIMAVQSPYNPSMPGSGIPAGYEAARIIESQLNLKFGNSYSYPACSMLLFLPNGRMVNVRKEGYTINGLSASRDSITKSKRYLQHADYRSAFSWILTAHIFDSYALRFETTDCLSTLLNDLQKAPHPEVSEQPLITQLFICAANIQNHNILMQFSNPSNFAMNDRFSKKLIGDMYRRFGDVKNALYWYSKADMPDSFVNIIRAEKPLFHQSAVSGKILLNGKPLNGVTVGALPWRLNGLPPYQELLLHNDINEIASPGYISPIFIPFHPRPFALRWISDSCITGSDGAFHFNDLTEGSYMLICSLPAKFRLHPPLDASLSCVNEPRQFLLNYAHPNINLGSIDLIYHGDNKFSLPLSRNQ